MKNQPWIRFESSDGLGDGYVEAIGPFGGREDAQRYIKRVRIAGGATIVEGKPEDADDYRNPEQ